MTQDVQITANVSQFLFLKKPEFDDGQNWGREGTVGVTFANKSQVKTANCGNWNGTKEFTSDTRDIVEQTEVFRQDAR